jgi:hypothetical protein
MKALLICPEHRPTGGVFQRMKPLALMPILGRSLLDHHLAQLKQEGYSEILILASDRPELIREAVGAGQAWGLAVEVIATPTELTPDVAELQFSQRSAMEARPLVRVLDRLPGLAEPLLWRTNLGTFEFLKDAIGHPQLQTPLTMQEMSPGVWLSSKARVSPGATLIGPVWIGPHASISHGARVGPNSLIEAGAFIDKFATIENAWIGPATYVGAATSVVTSCAWGDGLLGWKDGSFLEVTDRFLLSDLSRRTRAQQKASLPERLLALLLLLVTLPLALLAALRALARKQAVFREKRVILPTSQPANRFSRTHPLLNLNGAQGLFCRWPELAQVVRGEMALVGNRPLTAEQMTALRGPVGQRWLESPAGVFSLADAEGADGESVAESLAHAAYFTTKRSLPLRWRTLLRCLRLFFLQQPAPSTLPSTLPLPNL